MQSEVFYLWHSSFFYTESDRWIHEEDRYCLQAEREGMLIKNIHVVWDKMSCVCKKIWVDSKFPGNCSVVSYNQAETWVATVKFWFEH